MMGTLCQRRFAEYASYVVADSDFVLILLAIWRANARCCPLQEAGAHSFTGTATNTDRLTIAHALHEICHSQLGLLPGHFLQSARG